MTEIESFLASIPLFAHLDRAAIAQLASRLQPVSARGGEVVIEEGDESDSIFVVVSGRLRAYVTSDGERLVGEIARGEVIGEMGVLGGERRSASVRAVRDSELLKISAKEFLSFLHDHPEEMLDLSKLVIQRLRKSIRREGHGRSVRTIAVIPAGDTDATTFARFLTTALGERARVRLLTSHDAGDRDDSELAHWLQDLENANDLLVFLADINHPDWPWRCLRQADRVLLVAEAEGESALNQVERELFTHHQFADSTIDLIIIQPDTASRPRGATRWLPMRPVRHHHHVRLAFRDDIQRVARAITGRQIAVVLSGGGARGLSHAGTHRALKELGVPVDAVGGASFGALVGYCYAMGMPWEEQRQVLYDSLVARKNMVDITMPASALAKGRRVANTLQEQLGDALIENLWRRYFCVSSNLTRGEVMVHDRGLLWKATRASISIPGLLPPVRSLEGEVLVDGSVMNNLPVDIMQDFFDGGLIIAVNLKASADLPSSRLTDGGVMSGVRALAHRIDPRNDDPGYPGLLDILLRTTETGSVLSSKRMEEEADIVLRPDVSQFGMMAFERIDDIIEAGYQSASKELAAYEEVLADYL